MISDFKLPNLEILQEKISRSPKNDD